MPPVQRHDPLAPGVAGSREDAGLPDRAPLLVAVEPGRGKAALAKGSRQLPPGRITSQAADHERRAPQGAHVHRGVGGAAWNVPVALVFQNQHGGFPRDARRPSDPVLVEDQIPDDRDLLPPESIHQADEIFLRGGDHGFVRDAADSSRRARAQRSASWMVSSVGGFPDGRCADRTSSTSGMRSPNRILRPRKSRTASSSAAFRTAGASPPVVSARRASVSPGQRLGSGGSKERVFKSGSVRRGRSEGQRSGWLSAWSSGSLMSGIESCATTEPSTNSTSAWTIDWGWMMTSSCSGVSPNSQRASI